MMTNNSLASQLKQIGLCALPAQLDDFLARVTKARCSAHQILEEIAKAEVTERSRRSLERRLRISGIKRFKATAIGCAKASRKPPRVGGRNDSRRFDPGAQLR